MTRFPGHSTKTHRGPDIALRKGFLPDTLRMRVCVCAHSPGSTVHTEPGFSAGPGPGLAVRGAERPLTEYMRPNRNQSRGWRCPQPTQCNRDNNYENMQLSQRRTRHSHSCLSDKPEPAGASCTGHWSLVTVLSPV